MSSRGASASNGAAAPAMSYASVARGSGATVKSSPGIVAAASTSPRQPEVTEKKITDSNGESEPEPVPSEDAQATKSASGPSVSSKQTPVSTSWAGLFKPKQPSTPHQIGSPAQETSPGQCQSTPAPPQSAIQEKDPSISPQSRDQEPEQIETTLLAQPSSPGQASPSVNPAPAVSSSIQPPPPQSSNAHAAPATSSTKSAGSQPSNCYISQQYANPMQPQQPFYPADQMYSGSQQQMGMVHPAAYHHDGRVPMYVDGPGPSSSYGGPMYTYNYVPAGHMRSMPLQLPMYTMGPDQHQYSAPPPPFVASNFPQQYYHNSNSHQPGNATYFNTPSSSAYEQYPQSQQQCYYPYQQSQPHFVPYPSYHPTVSSNSVQQPDCLMMRVNYSASSTTQSTSQLSQHQPQVPHQQTPPMADHMDGWNSAVAKMENDDRIRAKTGLLICSRYLVMQKINVGSYGAIYTALDQSEGEHHHRQVAVKFETSSVEDSHIRYEHEVYKVCAGGPRSKKERSTEGFPQVYWFGEQYGYKIMVMELLGPSLENLFGYCSNQFRKETIYELGMQMLTRVEHLHSRGFVHRDLKPENFLMGVEVNENTCYLIDFGLARRFRFREGEKLTHVPYRKGKNLVGTAKYASLNSHNGIELSRRDDLESLGYILLEFMIGDLPWKETRARARFRSKSQCYNRIRSGKEQVNWSSVCPALVDWMNYARHLDFAEKPDYNRLRGYLKDYLRGKYDNVESDSQYLSEELESMAIADEADGCTGTENASDAVTNAAEATGKGSPDEDQQMRPDKSAGAKSESSSDPSSSLSGGVPIPSASTAEDPATSSSSAPLPDRRPFEWIERRESSADEKYTYQCLFRWTLPHGEQPALPPNHKSSMNFGYGFGEGGFA